MRSCRSVTRQAIAAAVVAVLLGALACCPTLADSAAAPGSAPGGALAPSSDGGTVSTGQPSIEPSGTALGPVSPSSVIHSPGENTGAYILGPGDGVSVRVLPQEKYSVASVPVLQDGTIFYPKIGSLMASGKTIDQLSGEIRTRLSTYCVNPDVTVTLISLRPEVVYVSGGVVQPKVLDLHAASTIAKAITLAGGPVDKYMLSRVTVIRDKDVLQANLYPLLVGGEDNGQNLSLRAGDLIVVPINTAKVTVLGAVTNPGTYMLEQTGVSNEGPMRLSDALSKAGGTDKHGVAKIGDVAVVSAPGAQDAKPDVHHYDYGKYLTKGDAAQNPVLRDNDVVVVPDNKHPDIGSVLSYVPFFYFFKGAFH